MIAVGIISLALGCVFLYVYQTRIKRNQTPKLRNASKLRALQKKNRDKQSDEMSIENVLPGGVIHLDGVGLRSESFDAQIIARHLHKRGSERWTELEADRGGSIVYLTVERDDEVSVNATIAQPSIESLGLRGGDLNQLSNGQTLTYEGTTYRPTGRGRAVFCRDHNELQPEEYEYWEFEDEDEEQFLTLVRWKDGSTEANYSVAVKPSFITIYSRT